MAFAEKSTETIYNPDFDRKKKISTFSRISYYAQENQWLQYIAGILATMPMFITGTVIGWTSPSLSLLLNHDPPLITESEGSWIASISSFGSIASSYFVGILTNRYGRKITLLSSVPFSLACWALLYAANDVAMIYVGRFLSGYTIAVCSMVSSLYIGEISQKNIRGRLLATIQFMSNLGTVVGLSVGPYVTYYHFLIILSSFPIFFFVTFIFMPKSPYYKIKMGDRDGAMKCLLRFRGLDDERILNEELKSMEKTVEFEMNNQSTYKELVLNKSTRKSLIVVLGVKTLMHFSGVAAIQSYIQPIFDQTDSFVSSAMVGILCGVIQLGAGLISYFFVDYFGRKPLLLGSLIGCLITLIGAGIYFFLRDYMLQDVTAIGWLPIVSILLFMAVQPIGVGSLAYVLLGELFPTNLKEKAGVTATIYGSSCSFIIVKLFGVISAANRLYLTFWLCAGFMFIGIFFTIFYVPETKQKSLHEIQNDINTN